MENLVSSLVQENLPEMLTETVKKLVMTTIVKQTKEELAGIHNNNFKVLENTVTKFAQDKIEENRVSVQEQVKNKFEKSISDELRKAMINLVIPHCEKVVEETMSELISNVKQSLDENESKVKEMEEKVDKYIAEHKAKQQYSEPTSAPVYRNYQRKEEETFGDIFKSNYSETESSRARDFEQKDRFKQEAPMPSMTQPTFSGSRDNSYSLSNPGIQTNEFMQSTTAQRERSWQGYGGNYGQMYTSGFSESMKPQYPDPSLEEKQKLKSALDHFMNKNVDCFFTSENIYNQIKGKHLTI